MQLLTWFWYLNVCFWGQGIQWYQSQLCIVKYFPPYWLSSGPISENFRNILVYICAKFGACITKCTIGMLHCYTKFRNKALKCKKTWTGQIIANFLELPGKNTPGNGTDMLTNMRAAKLDLHDAAIWWEKVRIRQVDWVVRATSSKDHWYIHIVNSGFLQPGRIAYNAEHCNSYANSVRLSVTRWYPIQTNEDRIRRSSLWGSKNTLVFWHQQWLVATSPAT